MHPNTTKAIDLLKKLIAIPSISKEESQATSFLYDYIKKEGYLVNRVENNLWIESSHNKNGKPTLLLNAHVDTVKPTSAWNYDPFFATEENGKFIGLGSNDDGASLVCLLLTFFSLSQKEQPYNLIFAISAEEEISGKKGIELLLNHLPKIDVALVGEPTQMNMAIAEKGLMVLDCTAHGKSGHAARNEGENAIYKALKDIEWFRTFQFPKQSEILGPVKMTTTIISAGTQHNVIPDICSFSVDIRSTDTYSNIEILEIAKQHIESEITPRSTRLNSSSIDGNHPIVKRGKELGKTTFGSPTLSDQALMPFPSLKMGPGDSARSHSADEYILIEEISEALSLYFDLLNDLKI